MPEMNEPSETGNWNSAKEYVQQKIMKVLADLDKYELLARFGSSELIEQFITTDQQRTHARIMALEWLHTTLNMLINNTYFAVRRKDDRLLLDDYRLILAQIEPTLSKIQTERYSHRTHTKNTSVNEIEFRNLLNVLLEIKTKINEPLNRADLIFRWEEEFDPRAYKKKIIERLTTQG